MHNVLHERDVQRYKREPQPGWELHAAAAAHGCLQLEQTG
jgi:hypothetical protein